jgi:O-antigen ligase
LNRPDHPRRGSPFADDPRGEGRSSKLRPWLLGAATALCVARPLFPSEMAGMNGDGLPVVMLWLVLAGAWLVAAIRGRRLPLRFGGTDAAVLLLIGLHAAAALWAAGHESPRPAINMLWEWVALGLSFLLLRQWVTGEREARALTAVMIALAVGLSAYGLYQRTVEMPQTQARYAADPEGTLRAAGFWFPRGSAERQHFEARLANREPLATFALTNSLAAMLAPWLVISLGIALAGRRSFFVGLGASSGTRSYRWLAVAAPLAACLALTKSRSSFVAVAFGLAMLAWIWGRGKLRRGWKLSLGIALAAVLLLGAALALGGSPAALLAKAVKSFGVRIEYWRATWPMIAAHPLGGCGPGNFQAVYTQYKLPQASEEVADPHDFLLEVWATAGTPTLLALMAVLGSFFYFTRRRQFPPVVPAGGDATAHVIAGGLLGFLLAVPLGQLSAAPPGLTATLVGLPAAAAAIFLGYGWIQHGRLPSVLPAVGVAVMLVNLLAAGGIGQPAVAGTLWLLMALGLRGDTPRRLPRAATGALLAAALALAAGCYLSGYSPVLRCRAHLQAAEALVFQNHRGEAEEELVRAAAADPLAAEPWRQLAALTFEGWQRRPSEAALERFALCTRNALERAPHWAANWETAGDRYREVFARTHQAKFSMQALAAYRGAVECYPNSALCHAKLALACGVAGEQAGLRREARIALDLDALMPHAEKRLPAALRQQLQAK